MPTLTATLQRQESGFVLSCFLQVPEAVAQGLLASGHRRLLVTINGKSYRRALVPSKEFGETVVFGQDAREYLGIELGQTVTCTLEPDPEPDNLEIPDELTEWLQYDEEANREWMLLPPGVRRSIAYYIRTGKRRETRLARCEQMLRRVKAGDLETQKAAHRRALKNQAG